MQPLALKNAEWWLNHSHVLIKGRLTAGDNAVIANGVVQVEMQGKEPVMVSKAGLANILKVQRMVTQGTVAVMLQGGQTYEVSLPGEVENLFPDDLSYICEQIDALSRPLSAQEQKDFLASASAPSAMPSIPESPSPASS